MYIIVAMMLLADQPPTSRQIEFAEAVQIAEKVQTYLTENVKDYTGMLVRREYVNGKDTGHQYLRFKFRENPLGIYLKFQKPASLQNREILYNGGDDIIVKRGGRKNSNMTLIIASNSPLATENSRYTIGEMGLKKLAEKLIIQLKTEMVVPNTEIVVYDNAKLDGRIITHYRMTHYTKTDATLSRQAEISIDKELNIPIYYRAIGWGEPTIVLEEYAFRDVVLNVGLTDADFSESNQEYGFQKKN
jgi:hypothetical protein